MKNDENHTLNQTPESKFRMGYENITDLMLPAPYKLLNFQVEAVFKMIKFLTESNGVYNACEPGLGKSVQTIATLNFFKYHRILIVCPAIMRLVWEKEISKFYQVATVPTYVIEKTKDLDDLSEYGAPFGPIVICSYELASTDKALKLFKTLDFEILVCDESHLVKNRKAKRTKAILNTLLPLIPKVIALSGTPVTACVSDLYTWANALAPTHFPNYYKFVNRYCNQERTPFGIKYSGIKNEHELSPLIRELFMIRYLKAEVLDDLPEKVWQEIPLPASYAVKKLPEVSKQALEEAVARMADAIETGVNKLTLANQNIVKSIRQAQGIETIKPVAEFASSLIEQEVPVIVFAYHKRVIEGLEFEFKLKGITAGVITGETTPKERMSVIEDFQSGKINVAILQSTAGGVGITLTRASTVIFAELDYSPAVINQCVARADRIGAEKKSFLNIYYFTIDGSIVSRIVLSLVEKTKTFEKLLK